MAALNDRLEGDELVSCLKQLVISFGPYLREVASAELAEEAIVFMEEYDPNFHRYEFVKRLRNKIETNLGSLVEGEMDMFTAAGHDAVFGQHTLVNRITDNIINSEQYREMMHGLKDNIDVASDYLLENFDEEFLGEGSQRSGRNSPRHKAGVLLFSDGESSLGDSSLNQSSFMFMNNEQFAQVAEALDKDSPIEMRREALYSMAQIPTLDVQNCEMWSNIRQGLLDALSHTDDTLWTNSIKFLARGFSCNSPSTREMYTTLVEFLSSQFNTSNKGNLPKLKNGCDCRKNVNQRLLKGFRLMNEFQQQVPQYWVRYPDRFLDEVLESTLSILAISSSSPLSSSHTMTPMHYLALIDPRANWFIKWMHGHYSRDPLLHMLDNYRNIIENAVKVCLDVAASRKIPHEQVSDTSDTLSRASSESRRMQYSSAELEFVYFIHSLFLLSRLLFYEKGRSFFPLKLKDREEPVTVTRLLVCLVQLLTAPHSVPPRLSTGHYEPGLLVVELFHFLCSSERIVDKCICKDDVTNALLSPISAWLDGSSDSSQLHMNETTLLQVADIISVLASSCRGRQHLLYGESQEKFTRASTIKRKPRVTRKPLMAPRRPRNKSKKKGSRTQDVAVQTDGSSAAFILAEFAKKALANELPLEPGPAPSRAVIGSFVYVCRQLYNTCEGLLVMYPYNLHTHIANAWREAVREADNAATPTPSMDGSENENRDSQYAVLWEDTLRDNLLNFAGTPKGLLLLILTGATNDGVSYLYSRYARKLQVSKCEKFGYGYMMSQVAATAAGMVALHNTGFIKALIRGLWAALEVVDDYPVYTPKSWPVNPIDKTARKSFSNLLNILSSFAAVNEVLGGQPLPTKEEYSFREMPETIPELLDRLVVINTDAKIHSLFNYEQSHIFGLKLLSAMISSLDTLLLLQTQYAILDELLKAQAQNVVTEAESNSEIMLDMLSVERNYVLVRAYVVGGPSERIIPPRSLLEPTDNNAVSSLRKPKLLARRANQDKGNPYPFPLFSTYPVPRDYMPTNASKSALKQETELTKFMTASKNAERDGAWFEKCRAAFCATLTSKADHPKVSLTAEILEKCVEALTKLDDAIFPLMDYMANDQQVKSYKLTPIQQEGVKVAVRYGLHLKLVSSPSDSQQRLTLLLKQCGVFLQQQQRNCKSSAMRCLQQSFPGFDWFVATIFLLMGGNLERSWDFLHNFSSLAHSAYLWTQRLHCSVHLKPELMMSGVLPLFSSTCHNIELLLQADVPQVYSAFKMSGYSPAQICQHWISQCFWNYLDWSEIMAYMMVCLMMGVDYQVYACVAILKFLQRDILQQMQEQNLVVFLREEPIRGFRFGDHLGYMQQLESRFRRTILKDMLNVSRP